MVSLVLFGVCQRQHSMQGISLLSERRDEISARLAAARAGGRCAGAIVLATCNRFEVIADIGSGSREDLRSEIFGALETSLVELRDVDVVRHLVRVAAGLESLVLGEDQIIGQVAQAVREAEARGLLGKSLYMMHSRVMHAARKVRGRRPVVAGPRSVAELAARIARESGPRIAIVGAGTTAQTAAECLRDLGARELHFCNRTVANAVRLANHFGGKASSLDDLVMAPPDVDAVVVAIAGRTLHLPVPRMPSLQTVVDISQPAVAVGLDKHPEIHHLDLDGLADLEQQKECALEAWRDDALALVDGDAERIWSELESGRADLGQLLGLHLENAIAEVDRALRGRLRDLDPGQAEEVRRLAERVARRNAHLHLSDAKHLASSWARS